MLEEIADPFGIFLICFLAFDSFDILGMSQTNIDLIFKNVKDGDPVFTGGFHTDIKTVIRFQPIFQPYRSEFKVEKDRWKYSVMLVFRSVIPIVATTRFL